MKRKSLMIMALIATVLHLGQNVAMADRRSYVWTYEYITMLKGATEFEYYFTGKSPSLAAFVSTTGFEHLIEFEHGLTDHWDIALYQVFAQKPEKEFKYEGFKIRTRYRFSERGLLPVDPLLYLEYIRKFSKKEDKIEGKLILAKDIWKFNVAANLIFEIESEGGEWEFSEKAQLAASFEPSPAFKIGGEYEISEMKAYIGPSISFASGKHWTTFGIRWGLTEQANDLDFRLLVGIGL